MPVPGSGNLLPRFDGQNAGTAWDFWLFDGFAAVDRSALVVSFNRNLDPRRPGSFKVEVVVVWPDQSSCHRELFFPESKVAETGDTRDVLGSWSNASEGSSVSFRVSADCSEAVLDVSVPGVVQGKVHLLRLPGDTGLDTPADLGPSVAYLNALGRAAVTASLKLYSSDRTSSRDFHLGQGDNESRGGMERCWSPFAWHQLMKESYRLRATVGPYSMSVMSISCRSAGNYRLYTASRLYRDGKLVCVAQQAVDEGKVHDSDFLSLRKVYDGNETAVTGDFHDKSTGYELVFGAANGRRWRFQVQHGAVAYNVPTSPPGPDCTGNTGFIESIMGGENEEQFSGVGIGASGEFSG
ncbi:hypothetical protein BDW66DRAFT_165258 [Aspergillus desertorum]